MDFILLDYTTLRVIWWLLLGILLIGFAVMDGFDLGVGTLLPFVARNDAERRLVINTIGPVWEGNQVWLILGGGAIFAAFPPLYAVSFSGFYLAMFLILFALILRPVRRFLLRLRPVPQASLLGRAGVVASPKVDARSGHATVDDGGAGLVLQIRSDIELQRGERIVLVEHMAEQHYYRVVRADAIALDFQDNLLPGNKETHQ